MSLKLKPATLADYKARLLRVLVHIQQHLDEPLGIDELARIACFSSFHFHHVFTGMMGESLKEHVRRLRLERAATHLKLGSRPVTEVALDAGFESHEAFTRAFKSSYGLPPTKYRSQRSTMLEPRARSGIHFRTSFTPRNFRTSQSGAKSMNVQIKTLEPMRVAFIRHVGPYGEVGPTWDKLTTQLGRDGWLAGKIMMLGICHDDPDVTPQQKIRYDACVTVDAQFQPSGEIGVQTVAGGSYAMTTHFGPYNKLGETYSALLGQWLPRSGRELRKAPCFEVYLNAPDGTEPEDLITDIYAPLQS